MRWWAKRAAGGVCRGVVLPVYGMYLLSGLLLGRERVFPGYSQAMSLLPGLVGQYVRRAFYRWVLPRCDDDCCIAFGTVFSHASARIGRTAYVGAYCVLGDVTLEDDVLVGSRVSIINGNKQHGTGRLDVPVREQPGEWPHVTIGRDTWIGDGAIVMADVGRQCVVGAGSVVTKPLPDFAVAAGNPARVVRFRDGQAEVGQVDDSAARMDQHDRRRAGSVKSAVPPARY